MLNAEKNKRIAGVLMHISSLPGPYGIGDIGESAYRFLAFLSEAGQQCWQFLPLGPVSGAFGYSPYMGSSSFAGNYLLISPDMLYEDGLVGYDDISPPDNVSEYLVNFQVVEKWKGALLEKAYLTFSRGEKCRQNVSRLKDLMSKEKWLYDYALFQALKEKFGNSSWDVWPEDIASCSPDAVLSAWKELEERAMFYVFEQFVFQDQWQKLRAKADATGIRLFGDMPVYVAFDSADVWANQECFQLDPVSHRPVAVAGVPPDYFSPTGQKWGNPLYAWKSGRNRNARLYEWWKTRFRRASDMFDMLRIDHFRGFEAYWSIPAEEDTAVNGKWIKGPGKKFFDMVMDEQIPLEIVAEDLGTITLSVERLRERLGFPGMKVLQFAFDSDSTNPYLPHNFRDTNCVVYTGTHDNDTIVGWYLDPSSGSANKERARRYANSDGNSIHLDFIRMAYASIASIAIIPMQDILGFGSDCRMNTPGTPDNNWRWRCAERFVTSELASSIREYVVFYNRGQDVNIKGGAPESDVHG